ncbi:MAG: hypothetical protein ACOX9R_16595 [Armatimonadota bacterium]|jgi:Flp pilus assembly secretin CpaC
MARRPAHEPRRRLEGRARGRAATASITLVAIALCSGVACAQAGSHSAAAIGTGALVLESGREVVLHFDGMRRVLITDPDVADVAVLTADDLLIRSVQREPLQDQCHTSLYVYDRRGLHTFAVTVVGYSQAERIARDLGASLGPRLSVQPVSDRMVVVDGEVASEAALANLKALAEAASTDDVTVVTMVTTPSERGEAPSRAAADALGEILEPTLTVRALGEDVIVVEGEVADPAAAVRVRGEVETIAGERLRVIDRIAVRGERPADQTPASQIRQVLGDEFTVTALRDSILAVEGTVSSRERFDHIDRLLTAFGDDLQIVNMVMVAAPPPDLATARQALLEMLGGDIAVTPIGNRALLLDGSVASEDRLAQVQRVMALFENVPVINALSVIEPDRRQVLVAVKVLEVTRGSDRDLGIDWGQYEGAQYDGALFRSQPFLFGQVPGSNSWPELHRFSSQVHALIAQQRARVLAEPNLLVNEEEDAEILIGGEIPVPISQEGVGGFASITVEWKPFGVNLKISPSISPDGSRVRLEVEPEVSSLDFANGVNIAGLTIPALRTRRTRTIVTVPDSGVLAIGGLINSDESKSVSKLPILGDLPIIGQFFRHDTVRSSRSELIVLVLPQILNEDGEPLHPIPIPEGADRENVMQFGTRSIKSGSTGGAD